MTPNYARLEAVRAVAEEARQGRGGLVGVACEKPLARTLDEAEEAVRLLDGTGLLHGYLENQVFAPSVVKGRDAVWRHGARSAGRPYLARAAEEHGGPHNAWFWDPRLSGGGVLLDMSCHSLEACRFLLADPGKPKEGLRPVSVQAQIASLKWTREPYLTQLRERYGVDYGVAPAEDYASVSVVYEDDEGQRVLSDAKTSWNYVGPGLRLSLEALGPEYSLSMNSLNQELSVFFSRNVRVPASEEFVEKQAAEQGLIPVVLAQGEKPFAIEGKEGLLVLSDRPINAETPISLLDDEVTPNDRHYIRNNGVVPERAAKRDVVPCRT